LLCFLEFTVPLEKMCSEDEAELIESEHRETVAPPEERKDTFSDLGHNQIVFKHRQAIVTDPAKTEILGNVIESLTRDRIVNVIEGTPCPAPWLGIEIDDIGTKRMNVRCGNELVCGPHLIAR
jgi:hypothetical protein